MSVLRIPRKILVTGAVVAGSLILYALFGFLAVPRIVRSQVEDFTRTRYQRTPALGEIRFNPFRLALEVRDFAFTDAAGAPMLSFDRLLVNIDVNSLWRRGLSFHVIELDRPGGAVRVRPDGSLNLSELTAPFAKTSSTETPDAEPARLFIDRLRLADGAIEFEDSARSVPFRARLAPVNFELLDFNTTGSGGNQYALQAQSSAGEKFRWSGNFGVAPLSSRGEFELTDVQARTLWAYLQESLGFEIATGVVGVNGTYEVAASEPDLTARVTLSRVHVNDLGVRPRDGTDDWIQLVNVTLEDTRLDATARVLDVARVRVDDSRVAARRDAEGTINLLTLLEPPASTALASAPQAASDPDALGDASSPGSDGDGARAWTVNLPDIAVNALRIELEDQLVRPAARVVIAPANLNLRGFSTAEGSEVEVDVDLALESGGHLMLAGKGPLSSERFAAKVTLEDLDLAALQPYVGTYTQMTLRSGLVSAELDTALQDGAIELAGNVVASTLHTVDNVLREDFIKWDRLALSGLAFRSETASRAASLRIGAIDARAPYVRFIIAPDQTTNVETILSTPASAPGPVQTVRGTSGQSPGPQRAMDIQIGRVQVRDGSANFADFWITPNYAVSLQQLEGSIEGLSSRKDSRAKVDLKGRIDRYAPAEISGELNLLSASLYTDLRVKFDGVELTSVTPYSGRFAGYRIEKGKLSVDVRYKVENRQLDAQQRFVVDQLTLGERVDSPDAVKLPLRLAVALLKDRNGVIDLGLPVTGSLDDPQFRLGPIIWKAFLNLLANVATSPFKLLGSLFGGGEEVNLIDFDAGSAELDAQASEKLAALARALSERPELALEVPAVWSTDADYAALASQQLDLALRARARRDAEIDAARRFELLLELHRERNAGAAMPPAAAALQSIRARDRDLSAIDAANAELEAALRPGIEQVTPALDALAQQRARNIQEALLAGGDVDPARIFLVAPKAGDAADGRTRTAITLR